jgi:hypothetical protein
MGTSGQGGIKDKRIIIYRMEEGKSEGLCGQLCGWNPHSAIPLLLTWDNLLISLNYFLI